MAFRKKRPASDPPEAPKQYYKDQLFPDAVEVTLETRCVSAGRLQSLLRIGSIRATNLIQELEEQGIIGPERGNRPREIFYTMERWNEEKGNFAWKPEPTKPDPASAVNQIHCPRCGRPAPEGASFCSHCGKKFTRKKNILFKIIGRVAVFVVLIGFVSYLISPEPDTLRIEPAMSKDAYKYQCRKISYETLARNPDSYSGEYFTFEGEVIQVVESGRDVQLRVNVTEVDLYGTTYYEDTIFVTTHLPNDGRRILEGDIIRLYGICEGLYTYTSIFGSAISIPGIYAEYWDIVN